MNAKGCPPGTLLLASSRCPWCASVPRVSGPTDTDKNRFWLVLCPNKECPVQPYAAGDSEAEAVGKWCERKAQ